MLNTNPTRRPHRKKEEPPVSGYGFPTGLEGGPGRYEWPQFLTARPSAVAAEPPETSEGARRMHPITAFTPPESILTTHGSGSSYAFEPSAAKVGERGFGAPSGLKRKASAWELSNDELMQEFGLPPKAKSGEDIEIEADMSFTNSPKETPKATVQEPGLSGDGVRFVPTKDHKPAPEGGRSETAAMDHSQRNFEKLSKPVERKAPEEQPPKRAKTHLSKLWEVAIKPILGLSNLFLPKPKEACDFAEPQFDLDVARFWSSVSKRDLHSLSAEAIRKYKQFFEKDVGYARHKLLERPLAVHFQGGEVGATGKAEIPDNVAGHLRQVREKAYLAYHPIVASLVETWDPLSYADRVIHKSLASRLEAASQTLENHAMASVWRLLGFMVGEIPPVDDPNHFVVAAPGTLREANELRYASFTLYAQDSQDSVFQYHRRRLAKGALHYLQSRFYQHIKFALRDHLAGSDPVVQLGGSPNIDAYLRAYATLLLYRGQRPELVDNASAKAWALIFLCFRCGFYDRMLKYATQYQQDLEILQSESVEWGRQVPFFVLLSIFVSGERFLLPPQYRAQLLDAYLGLLPDAEATPFRAAMYSLLVRDPEGRLPASTLVIQSREDFVWWNLLHVASDDGMPLRPLQQQLLSLNPNPTDLIDVVVYARGLLLTQQFEEAVAVLASKPILECEALHLACALIHYGLLRVTATPDVTSYELVVNEPSPCLNLMLLFSRTLPWFTAMEPTHFMDYLAYLPLLPNPSYRRFALECVRNLVMGTDAFRLLLEPHSLLKRYGSAFDRPHSPLYDEAATPAQVHAEWLSFVDHLTRSAAAQCISSMDFSLGMDLFFSIGDCDTGVQTINACLAERLAQLFKGWSLDFDRLVSREPDATQLIDGVLNFRRGLAQVLSRGILDPRYLPAPATRLVAKRLEHLVILAEAVLRQDGPATFAAAQMVGLFPHSPALDAIQSWEADFRRTSPHLQKLVPHAMVVVFKALQLAFPGLLPGREVAVGGVPMPKLTKAQLLLAISSVAVHYPRLFPGVP
ncbi:nuclear pore complex subunit [Massospora cicadina]|nr:nuclear pore complex subunit [Massospora cicadina]